MPFGMQMDSSLTSSGPARNKFTGHETDEETQLVHMEWRGYLAEFGRFMSVDPLADDYPGWSPYVYALNNTLRFNDPTGLCPEDGSAGENQFGPGLCMEAVVVTATRLPATRPLSITSFVTFAIPTARVGGQALVRSPNPYAIGAGIILIGGAIVADQVFNPAVTDEMFINAQEYPFEDVDMTDVKTWPAPPTDLPVEEGAPSRKKAKERGEKSLWDSQGGEWRPHRPDKYHPQGHWDYKPPGSNTPWRNVYSN